MRRFYFEVFVKLFSKSLWALGEAQGLNFFCRFSSTIDYTAFFAYDIIVSCRIGFCRH